MNLFRSRGSFWFGAATTYKGALHTFGIHTNKNPCAVSGSSGKRKEFQKIVIKSGCHLHVGSRNHFLTKALAYLSPLLQTID